MLPPPKDAKGKSLHSPADPLKEASPSQPQSSSRSQITRAASRAVSSSHVSETVASEKLAVSKAPPSKRPLSPEAIVVDSRKKTRTKTVASKEKAPKKPKVPSKAAIAPTVETSAPGSLTLPPNQAAAPETSCSVPKWSIVKTSGGQEEDLVTVEHVNSAFTAEPFTGSPRVWTNSRSELLAVFPDLGKAPTSLSWLHSETPVLMLDRSHPQDRWTGPTTLNVTTTWDFSCDEFALEPCDSSLSSQTLVSPESNFKDASQSTHLENHVIINPKAVLTLPNVQSETATKSEQTPQDPPDCDGMDKSRPHEEALVGPSALLEQVDGTGMSLTPITSAVPPALLDTVRETSDPATKPPPHVMESLRGRLPAIKPPDIHILLDSRAHLVPVLVWSSRSCKLTPRTPSSEYAYSCLGFFFISDLRQELLKYSINPTTKAVRGRVRWYTTLEWAPGGEEALLAEIDTNCSSEMIVDDQASHVTRKDLSRPWWSSPTETDGPSVDNEAPIPYRPRDLRMHYYSYLPLDLLADFQPSESFPRGWFCMKCGMINAQKLFRHQICQSSVCKSTCNERSRQGKVDPLSKLRDPHHTYALVQPVNNVPSFIPCRERSWDEGMQYWTYLIKDDVSVQHVFTRNEEHLQTEATSLLEDIQRDVLLSKEESSSPYFVHTTPISYANGASEATIPGNTPACVRSAFHCLVRLAERYGEISNIRFDRCLIQAWVTSGSKKGQLYRARKSPVVILSLGAEVVLNFVPKAGYGSVSVATAVVKVTEADSADDQTEASIVEKCLESPHNVTPMQDSADQRPSNRHLDGFAPGTSSQHEKEVAAGVMDVDNQQNGLDLDGYVSKPGLATNTPLSYPGIDVTTSGRGGVIESKPARGRKKIKTVKEKNKTPAPDMSMTLVHGDSAILIGDDFECQIVRTGTTILVIGSTEGT
ncbi:hypothetical protein HYDPIDRAFT_110377 [Hydnomerulius pinastri MD-312]|nr:hypothetical protein HYDPIDRAFT_110377 [Hydnomerulius pinastri MD-312]